jgi:predicted dehydrogenase
LTQGSAQSPRIALIGCGAIATSFHLPALARNPAIRRGLVLVDPAAERAQELAERFGAASVSTDLGAVLGSIDGAIVAVPPHLHHPVALECLRNGVHVLCEKPLCEEPARARELVSAAEQAGVTLSLNQTRRLFPAFREVRRLLAEGQLGRLRKLDYVLGEPFDWPAASNSYFGANGGGKGVLLDTGAHVVDLVCWFLGGRPDLVEYRDDSSGGTEAVAEVKLVHQGCEARIRLSWLSKLENVYRIEGERGEIEGGVYEWGSYTLRPASGKPRKVSAPQRVRGFQDVANALIDNFLEVIRGRAEPLVPGREVLPSIELIDACYSRRSRFELPWHDAFERLAHG